MKRFAVFASGRGSNLDAIIRSCQKGRIAHGKLALVFSDKPQALALQKAKKAGIATVCIEPSAFSSREDFDKAVLKVLGSYRIDWIVLAGYMRLLSGHFIKAYPNRIINIHPALLPSFKGVAGIKDAFDAGVKISGVTVHFVVEEMDAGPIIMQEPVRILATDTMESFAKRLHHKEHGLYSKAIETVLKGAYRISGRKVILS